MGKRQYRDDSDSESEKFLTDVGALDAEELDFLKLTGRGPYSQRLDAIEQSTGRLAKLIEKQAGLADTDTGLAPSSQWDLEADRATIHSFMALQIANITSILGYDKTVLTATGIVPVNSDDVNIQTTKVAEVEGSRHPFPGAVSAGSQAIWRACIDVHGHISYVVGKDESVAPVDLEEGMRVACERGRYTIKFPLPPLIDPAVSLMQVDERPVVTYKDIGGCAKQLRLIRESLELPLLQPQRFEALGIEPCRGILFYGSPGSGKTLTARAVANRTESSFIRVLGSELVSKYSSEGARMVREIFSLARTKKSAIIFFDEVDSWGLKRSTSASETGDLGVQRTMLELITQLDGFNQRGNVKVIMASNRPDILDSALTRPGRIDRKIEFGPPDQKGREEVYTIYLRKMSVEKNIRVKLLARLSPSATGAEIRSICTEAGMFCLRDKRRLISEADFLKAINKVVKDYRKLVSTAKYAVANNI